MRALIPCLLLAAAAGAAEPPLSPWPKPTGTEVKFVTTAPKDFPSGLDFDEVSVEGHEPHDIGICWLDLNRDGAPELLVDSHEGGTGGSYKLILARTPSGFRRIAGWQGGIILLPAVNGYLQIESWSSSGGGEFSRMLYRYESGRYRMVRLEDWQGSGDDGGWRFVRSRDPKPYDNE